MALLRGHPQAGGAQCLLDIKIGPEPIDPKQDMAHGCLDLGGDRRHATRELALERADVVVDAESPQALLQLPGEPFTRTIRLLQEKEGPHRAKQRSRRPFARAMGALHHALLLQPSTGLPGEGGCLNPTTGVEFVLVRGYARSKEVRDVRAGRIEAGGCTSGRTRHRAR